MLSSLFAAVLGARDAVPPETRADVDAVERRLVELADADAAAETAAVPVRSRAQTLAGTVRAVVLVSLAGLALAVACGALAAATFRTASLVLTGLYFVTAAVSAALPRK